ncbi:MAG: VWA domain-containing protein [bacterium]|nr:VWA domain-containing protein [bacterium]
MTIVFANPLAFLLVIPLILWVYFELKVNQHREIPIKITSFKHLMYYKLKSNFYWNKIFLFLRTIVFLLLILAFSRPQSVSGGERSETEGVDIILVIDVSGSMLALDFEPKNRLEAAKEAAKQFVDNRKNDRIGLVVFSKEAYTQCPLTIDHTVLKKMIDLTRVRELEEDGTAIGAGLIVALNRLQASKSPSKVIILLTDGVNNQMVFSPLDAAEKAKEMKVKVYTVGVGKKGMAPYPVQTPFGTQMQMVPVEIDEELLQAIADKTGGTYNRATDQKSLRTIYAKIDQMERYKIEGVKWRRIEDLFHWFVLSSLLLLGIEYTIKHILNLTVQ